MAKGPGKVGADAAMAAAVLLLGGYLAITGLGLAKSWGQTDPGRQAPDLDQLLGAATTAAGVTVAGWWALSMFFAFLAAVLERTGRHRAAATAGRFCPGFMRRLALAVLSVQLVSAPLAHADEPASGPAWGPTQPVAAPAGWGPTTSRSTQISIDSAASALDHQAPLSSVEPSWRPSSPISDPGLTVAWPVRQGPLPSQADVTVLAGDTLWDIAARALGPAASDVEVALHWPRWYQANIAEIGENPDVLLPGQILKPPTAA